MNTDIPVHREGEGRPSRIAHRGPLPERKPLHLDDGVRTAAIILGAMAVCLGISGLANSYSAVSNWARPEFGNLARTVPISIDLAIFVFSGMALLLAALDLARPWIRMVPAALVAATIYLNVTAAHTVAGAVAHAVMPGLWVVVVEAAYTAISIKVGLASNKRQDPVRLIRWALAPISTFRLWRRMKLWEILAYREGLAMEAARLRKIATLHIGYGPRWRRNAPLTELYNLKLHGLPVEPLEAVTASPVLAVEPVRTIDTRSHQELAQRAVELAAELGRQPGVPTLMDRLEIASKSKATKVRNLAFANGKDVA